MKKWGVLSLLFVLLLTLAGCESIERTLRGDDYVNQQIAASSSQAEKEKATKELHTALKAKASSFPQLTDTVSKNEAEILMTTSLGDITIKLFPKYAPLAVENFLTHAKEGYYDNLTFHRVINNFIIQSGDPNGDGTGGKSIWKGKDKSIDSGNGFKNEISPYLYNIRGSLAMANRGENTNGSQFYINQNSTNNASTLKTNQYPKAIIDAYKKGGNPDLDGQYTVFGQVISGMDVVDKIAQVETDDSNKPKTDVTIKTIKILKDYQFD
ncbi:peptidylprolyl isomerase [Streptococcus sciuri]|uniref:Peptidyl-prolyl cis-trans isomerase n=1 Tax=Streptococcus sciuri TaxID=2973939 RepID=A0ABT2F6P6_9STRE|nr:peptidylprolyl isomerase [Streptococcus sciuri]MCS4488099.1 peptidylprolyl isomerase [Streptococcus sciuri]